MSETHSEGKRNQSKPKQEVEREFRGIVRAWDKGRHCWLVQPYDKRLADMALTPRVLREFGRERLSQGVEVTGLVLTSDPDNGLLFLSIQKINEEEPPPRVQVDRPPVIQTGGPQKLKMKWIDRVKGYGFFVQGEGLQDIFVSVRAFEDAGLPFKAEPNTEFIVTWGDNCDKLGQKKGLIALTVAAV